jgi:hypothetical protein
MAAKKKISSLADNPPVELYGPEDGGWYSTRVHDWIALCPDLRDPDVRGYLVLRSLIIEKYKNPVRKLTVADLCELIPSPTKGQPSSLTRVRGILDALSAVGLVSTPEGGPVKTSSRPSATVKPIRIRVNDMPKDGYAGWRNTEDKLQHVGQRRSEQTAEEAGRKSDPGQSGDAEEGSAGRKSDPAGLKSDPRGRESDPDPRPEQEEPDVPLVPTVGTTTGGDALSARSAGDERSSSTTGSSAREVEGGSAASSKDQPAPTQHDTPTAAPRLPENPDSGTASKKAGKLKHTSEQLALVRAVHAFFPAELAVPSIPLVSNAILAALAGDVPGADRTVAQLGARIERRWHQHGWALKVLEGETIRSAAGVAIDLVRPYGRDDKWGCSDPRCEAGKHQDTEEPCQVCPQRIADRRTDRRNGDEKPPMPGQRSSGECAIDSCALPLPADSDDILCPRCRKRSDATRVAFVAEQGGVETAARYEAPEPQPESGGGWAEDPADEQQRREAAEETARLRAQFAAQYGTPDQREAYCTTAPF